MNSPRLSICILTLQTRAYIQGCLNSIYNNPPGDDFEIIVVDNGSTDGTVEMIQSQFPSVRLTVNPKNLGFTTPMNQALHQASGEFYLLLNPDTIIHPRLFDTLIEFMDTHPGVGICGPKVLNTDGTLQEPCRRGESTPWAVISYFLRLNRLFPRSRFFGGYLLNYMDEDQIHEVAGVSGSCMLVRKVMTDQIGYLDETYFAYQEDADYCFRARKAGWKVFYVPTAKITHYGGQGGSKVQPYRSILEWHRSYLLYYRKNLSGNYLFLFNWLYYLVILVKLAIALLINSLRKDKAAGRQKPK